MKTFLALAVASLLSFAIFSGFEKKEKMVNNVDLGVVVSDSLSSCSCS